MSDINESDLLAAMAVASSITQWANDVTEALSGVHFVFRPQVEVWNSRGYKVAEVTIDYDTAQAIVSFGPDGNDHE
jgi:hypothetical protein